MKKKISGCGRAQQTLVRSVDHQLQQARAPVQEQHRDCSRGHRSQTLTDRRRRNFSNSFLTFKSLSLSIINFCLLEKDEKNQIMTTDVWITQVRSIIKK